MIYWHCASSIRRIMPKEKSLILRGFWGFDRTYEELKRESSGRLSGTDFRFDRTYEELKPF